MVIKSTIHPPKWRGFWCIKKTAMRRGRSRFSATANQERCIKRRGWPVINCSRGRTGALPLRVGQVFWKGEKMWEGIGGVQRRQRVHKDGARVGGSLTPSLALRVRVRKSVFLGRRGSCRGWGRSAIEVCPSARHSRRTLPVRNEFQPRPESHARLLGRKAQLSGKLLQDFNPATT